MMMLKDTATFQALIVFFILCLEPHYCGAQVALTYWKVKSTKYLCLLTVVLVLVLLFWSWSWSQEFGLNNFGNNFPYSLTPNRQQSPPSREPFGHSLFDKQSAVGLGVIRRLFPKKIGHWEVRHMGRISESAPLPVNDRVGESYLMLRCCHLWGVLRSLRYIRYDVSRSLSDKQAM